MQKIIKLVIQFLLLYYILISCGAQQNNSTANQDEIETRESEIETRESDIDRINNQIKEKQEFPYKKNEISIPIIR